MAGSAGQVFGYSGAPQVQHGGAGDDIISASPGMTFDWVPDGGNSQVWTSYWLEETLYWNEDLGAWTVGEPTEVHATRHAASTAFGSVTFDTPTFGQSFALVPAAFHYTSSPDGWHWTQTLATLDYPSEWAWNPETRVLDPLGLTTSPDHHNARIYFNAGQVNADSNTYPSGIYQAEYGHWVLRETGDLTAFGGDGNDRIHGGTGNDRLFGEAGDDEILGGLGASFLSGGRGHDRLTGGVGMQVLDGGAGNDTLTGGTGDQTLAGGSGHDVLAAGRGHQMLDGGSGNDTLLDGYGDTVMAGGSGGDTFVFTAASGGTDKILDFRPAHDHFRIEGIAGLTAAEAVLGTAADLGGSTLIDLGGDHTVLLVGVELAQLAARAEGLFTFG